jgi:hypothetical protein
MIIYGSPVDRLQMYLILLGSSAGRDFRNGWSGLSIGIVFFCPRATTVSKSIDFFLFGDISLELGDRDISLVFFCT